MKQKLITSIIILLSIILFLLYSLWYPKAEIFGKSIYKIPCENNCSKCVYLTFDDGPSQNTLKVLEILNKTNTTATFFLIGKNIERNPNILKQIVLQNHSVGIHCYEHKPLFFNNYNQITKTQDLIFNITNQKTNLFRPPYGFRSLETYYYIHKLNLSLIMWDVFPRDYEKKSNEIHENIMNHIKSGSIIVLHDAPGNRSEMLNILEKIIIDLKKQGYCFEKIYK